ncbi:hypothetical protein OTK49_00190 [Vibrio coralliirubri]|uniref:hypothetical protein n=1 Tax=Vibrio coralliirubri TaxID=1516159 RepID=UPI002284D1B3|nr:hypothetical protein [Vibrio coralliirubri]MCY9860959.1 hypothetical protein [Vibrio coralliirubri]
MKLKCAALVGLLVAAPLAHAEHVGVGVKWAAFMPTESTNSESPELDNGETNLGVELQLEHSVPFLPNLQAEFTEITGQDFKYMSSTATAYYSVIDYKMVGFDLGVGASSLRSGKINPAGNSIGSSNSTSFDGSGAHVYVAGEFAMPFMPNLAIIASAKKSISSDLVGSDIKLAAQYTHSVTKFDLVLQGGFRDLSHELSVEDVDHQFNTSGFFASVGIDF